jgi:hypothetical protein
MRIFIFIFCAPIFFCGCSDESATNQELVKFEIGKHRFAAARRNLSNKEWAGGRTTTVNAEAIFSDLKDLTLNNEFEKKGYNKKVLLTISERKNRLSIKKNFEAQLKRFSPTGSQVDIDGLKILHFSSPNETTLDEMYAIMKGKDVERYVVCYKYGMAPYPTCQSVIDYDTDLVVEYMFDRQHLPEWVNIDQKVTHLVKSFEKIPQ